MRAREPGLVLAADGDARRRAESLTLTAMRVRRRDLEAVADPGKRNELTAVARDDDGMPDAGRRRSQSARQAAAQ